MPKPLLSIVTPSLNQGRYIGQCLESVAREMATPTARDLGVEHIVMDGGSTDETVALLQRATHLAHWQSEPDGGQSSAINAGLLRHATGRFATWLNADDWYEPGALEPMLRRLAEQNAPDVLVGRCRFVEGEHTIFSPRPPEPIDMANLLRLRTRWFAGELIVQPEAFFGRDMFARIGGLNEDNHFTMDHELWLRLLEAGARFESIDHPVACMRVHEAQKTADNRRIVASLIRYGKPFLERHPEAVGDAAAFEIEALERKLTLSEPVLRRLRAPWDARRDGETTTTLKLSGPANFHLAPLRAVLEGIARKPGALRKYRARVIGDAPADLPVGIRRCKNGPVDAVVLWHALSASADPASMLREAIDTLQPGGFVIAVAEINACEPGLREYTQGLARLVDQQLSQDHDWLIDPAARPWVQTFASATADDDARWLAANPRPFGIQLNSLMESAGMRRHASMAYGGMSWHPLTPFGAIEGVPGRDAHAWCCGVWFKP